MYIFKRLPDFQFREFFFIGILSFRAYCNLNKTLIGGPTGSLKNCLKNQV